MISVTLLGIIPAARGEAEHPLRIAQRAIIIPRAQERKRRAAAFTFQAVAPGIIPAEQGEAGIRFGSHNVQSLYQKTELFGISNEILENTKSSALYFWEYKIWYK